MSADQETQVDIGSDSVNKSVVFFKWGTQNAPFHCQTCNQPFQSADLLKWHVSKQHSGSVSNVKNTCSVCNSSFPTPWSLQQHETTHRLVEKCQYCGVVFVNKARLDEHIKGHTNLMKCPKCPQKFLYQNRLDLHMLTHQSKSNFECKICSKKFVRQETLEKHLLIHNKKDAKDKKKFTCAVCFKGFPTLLLLKEHSKNVHGYKDARRKCEICGKIVQYSGMTRHKKTHFDQRDYQCVICDRKFFQSEHLVAHLTTHSDDKNFVCSVCGESFKGKRSLQRHSNIHWLGNFGFASAPTVNSQVSTPSANSSGSNFQCMVCKDVDFEEEKLLIKHIRERHIIRHVPEKKKAQVKVPDYKYQCIVCKKLLTERSLSRHILSHEHIGDKLNGGKNAYILLDKNSDATLYNSKVHNGDDMSNGDMAVENSEERYANSEEINEALIHSYGTLESSKSMLIEDGTCNGKYFVQNGTLCKGTSLGASQNFENGLTAAPVNSEIKHCVEDSDIGHCGNEGNLYETIPTIIQGNKDASQVYIMSNYDDMSNGDMALENAEERCANSGENNEASVNNFGTLENSKSMFIEEVSSYGIDFSENESLCKGTSLEASQISDNGTAAVANLEIIDCVEEPEVEQCGNHGNLHETMPINVQVNEDDCQVIIMANDLSWF
ncbi:zinc finger protein 26-like [Dreissena polymorpha]|uniref:C2H2-type domain-containing protein n=1 Tax=Dreissena polymorpha TaxID=45954 RepID=A0A9D4DB00_DREPO|nr:zinc finger protein 26-like [Dreissena polymorpha]KAH3741387.1 hypothetical protein DPMN_048112 [Dreissena polymorpha]